MKRQLKFRQPIIEKDGIFSGFDYWGFRKIKLNNKGVIYNFLPPANNLVDAPHEQFTGLQDKNGNDIYEGDWCKAMFRTREGIKVVQGEIIMDDFMWCIKCPPECGDDLYSINRLHKFEIIGNIHQNPELCTP